MAIASVPARQPTQNQGDAASACTDSAENGARSGAIAVQAVLAAIQANANHVAQDISALSAESGGCSFSCARFSRSSSLLLVSSLLPPLSPLLPSPLPPTIPPPLSRCRCHHLCPRGHRCCCHHRHRCGCRHCCLAVIIPAAVTTTAAIAVAVTVAVAVATAVTIAAPAAAVITAIFVAAVITAAAAATVIAAANATAISTAVAAAVVSAARKDYYPQWQINLIEGADAPERDGNNVSMMHAQDANKQVK
jgi:hypothetical protein